MEPKLKSQSLSLTVVLLVLANVSFAQDHKPIKSNVKFENGQWTLFRDGAPYYIKGAGGLGPLNLLADYGGNSNRTWGVDSDTLKRLDEAHANGISVTLGIWLEHATRGYDYQDFDQVNEQIEKVMDAVRKYKNHPAVLMWGIGNEMEGYDSGDNPAIWHHVDHLCRLVKQEDPNHPTITVIAEIGGNRIDAIHKFCPNVDVIGINAYGGAVTIPERYKKAGGKKPYVVTEFGPFGPWEVDRNEVNAVVEPFSDEKAAKYKESYNSFVADKPHCLGSYSFLWGQKMEATATWFGMLMEDDRPTSIVDVMSELWTGKPPKNIGPIIESLRNETGIEVDPGQELEFSLSARDQDSKQIHVEWLLRTEADAYITYGEYKPTPRPIEGAIVEFSNTRARIRAPQKSGLFRLYVIVEDAEKSVATANLAFRVKFQPLSNQGTKVNVPFNIYDETNDLSNEFDQFGLTGDSRTSVAKLGYGEDIKFGKSCIQFIAQPGQTAGASFSSKTNKDLMGAARISFWAKGTTGKEQVTVGFGDCKKDTFSKEKTIPLTRYWKKFHLDFANADLRRIGTGFYWRVEPSKSETQIFFDKITIE